MQKESINKEYKFNTRIIMSDFAEMPSKEAPMLSEWRYKRAISKITLLRVMLEIDNMEVKRLLSQLESPDPENWTVAEECIKQKLAV